MPAGHEVSPEHFPAGVALERAVLQPAREGNRTRRISDRTPEEKRVRLFHEPGTFGGAQGSRKKKV